MHKIEEHRRKYEHIRKQKELKRAQPKKQPPAEAQVSTVHSYRAKTLQNCLSGCLVESYSYPVLIGILYNMRYSVSFNFFKKEEIIHWYVWMHFWDLGYSSKNLSSIFSSSVVLHVMIGSTYTYCILDFYSILQLNKAIKEERLGLQASDALLAPMSADSYPPKFLYFLCNRLHHLEMTI